MIDITQLIIRFMVALVLGALIGLEREMVGKEAGLRTTMMVAGGAALFTLAGLELPYLVAQTPEAIPGILQHSSFMNVIANIVVGIGFLGAGIIIKTENHVYGLTSAAVIWTVAAIGVLAGLGQLLFGTIAAIIITIVLFALRGFGISELKK